jgi:chitin disaccharide deacetylase
LQLGLFGKGAVTHGSLLVNGVHCEEMSALCGKEGLPLGLHLNLTEGSTLSDPIAVPSLVRPRPSGEGYEMLGKHGLREAITEGKVSAEHLAMECEAQIRKFLALRATGEAPWHLDGHQHIHVIPEVVEVLIPLLRAHCASSVRLPELHPAERSRLESCGPRREFFEQVSSQATSAREAYEEAGLRAPRAFLGFTLMGTDMSALEQVVAAALPSCSGFCELMCHPGAPTDEHSLAGCGSGPDEFSQSPDREAEASVLSTCIPRPNEPGQVRLVPMSAILG